MLRMSARFSSIEITGDLHLGGSGGMMKQKCEC